MFYNNDSILIKLGVFQKARNLGCEFGPICPDFLFNVYGTMKSVAHV